MQRVGKYERVNPFQRFHSLQNFTNIVLADGLKRGRTYSFGNISRRIVKDLTQYGISLKSHEVVIEDKTILKYVTHPKNEKGAAVSFTKMDKAERAITHPKHIYQDVKHGKLIYIQARGYRPEQYVKTVIHVNRKIGKKYVNVVKSMGIVNKYNLRDKDKDGKPLYRQIK